MWRKFMGICFIWLAFSASVLQAVEVKKTIKGQIKNYIRLAGTVDIATLKRDVAYFSHFPSRLTGYPGCEEAAKYIEREFKKIGLEKIRVEEFPITVPVDHGSSLEVLGTGKVFKLHAIWPNLVRTSQTPPEGIKCHLIYGASGKLTEFNGKKVEGSAVLMDFNCGNDWINAPRFGAKAVIFIAPETTVRGEAEAKFLVTPVFIPRFWISREQADELLKLVRVNPKVEVRIKCQMRWEKRKGKNITAILPGRDKKFEKEWVVIESYYDSISAVPSLAPGAESSCGIATMLQIARTFKRYPPKRTIMFLATSGHFESLTGIREYLERHFKEFEKKKQSKIYLFSALDLSSQTERFGIFYKAMFYDFREDLQREFSDIGRVCRENSERIIPVVLTAGGRYFEDGINPVQGKSWRTFIPGKIGTDNEAVTLAGGKGICFMTVDDSRALVDTPLDTADKVNFKNLEAQAKLLVCLYHHILNDPRWSKRPEVRTFPMPEEPMRLSRLSQRGGFGTISGRVVWFDYTSSLTPNTPVHGAVAVLRSYHKSLMGVRGNNVQLVDEKARFKYVGEAPISAYWGWRRKTTVEAYHLDPKTGEIDYAPDRGIQGARNYPIDPVLAVSKKEIMVVLFKCVSVSIFDLVDQQTLRTLRTLNIYDGTTDGEMRNYGFSMAWPEAWIPYIEDCAIIFVPRKSRVKLIMGAGPAAKRLVLLNNKETWEKGGKPEGNGYYITRDCTFYNTTLRVAEDMWRLDEGRIKKLAKYRIVNEAVNELHAATQEYIKRAKADWKALNYDKFAANSRAAWGCESRAYPDVDKTMKDIIKGVIFYLALLLPFVFFLERLFVAARILKWQLAWMAGLFIFIFIIFRYAHPAFEITMSPLIVLLAFVMLSLGVLVIGLVASKFEERLKAFQGVSASLHRADISRIGVAAAAFSLGISNMRRRKARTALTCATLIFITFIVLSLTSIVSNVRLNDVPAKGKPIYQGLLIRSPIWEELEDAAYRIVNDEFGATRHVAPRAWFLSVMFGEQAFFKMENLAAGKAYDVNGIVGLTPEEKYLTKVDKTLLAGRWFEPGDVHTCIIAKGTSEALAIDKSQMGKAKLRINGVDYTVIGIIDTKKFKTVLDLDQEMLTPVDFILMSKLTRQGQQLGEAGFREYIHLSPESVVFIPYQTVINLGARPRSIAVDLRSKAEVQRVLKKLMKRLNLNVYAGIGKKIRRYSSIVTPTATGRVDVVIPILIAAMIVLNTMLGSVYERVKEIGIFSSVGLAPVHIGTLFMAESLVYAVLGSVGGYLVGQGVAKVLTLAPGVLSNLYLNYSSLSAVSSIFVVIFVVMLSTAYPARKASEVATPAVERTWKLPEPEGDEWHIDLPFTVTGEQAIGLNKFMAEWFESYEEYSIGDFISQDVKTSEIETDSGRGYSISLMAWLAPFDLGVSQKVEILTMPTEMEDVYDIRLHLHRESGDVSSWKRVNRRFMNTLRKQFLIWRTLRTEQRERYLR